MEEYILTTKEDGSVITVRDVQNVLLEMLLEIERVCKKNDITYFLTGGSCLGAVRHKGFIPWDDDADIGMLYEDYVKFQKIAATEFSEGYYVQSFETHKEYCVVIPAMKIRKEGTYVKEKNHLLANKCKDGDGLFIDVFIIDSIAENRVVDFSNRIWMTLLMGVITGLENIGMNPYRLKKYYVNHARRYSKKHKNSSLIGFDLTWCFDKPWKPVVYKKEDIFPIQYHEFEHEMLPIPKIPKSLLDVEVSPSHMEYPPLKDQQPKHIEEVDL